MISNRKPHRFDGPSAEDRAIARFADLMAERIKEIQTDWKKPWFDEGAMRWPRNLSGREYGGLNAMMLMMQSQKMGYTMPYWCTFNRVSSLNFVRQPDGSRKPAVGKDGEPLPPVRVNSGEKSFPVFITTHTCVNKESREKLPYEEYKKLSEEERANYTVYPKLQVFNVFNTAQTNLQEARPELYAKLEAACGNARAAEQDESKMFRFAPLDEMVKHQLWYCPIVIGGDEAYYSLSRDEIHIPERKNFIDGESWVGTLVHEAEHSCEAATRLNKLTTDGFGSESYSVAELRAELTSALVCSRYGITKHVKDASAPYLKAWLDHLNQEPSFLKSVLFDVKRASALLTDRINLIQSQIDRYQSSLGSSDLFPSTYDLPDRFSQTDKSFTLNGNLSDLNGSLSDLNGGLSDLTDNASASHRLHPDLYGITPDGLAEPIHADRSSTLADRDHASINERDLVESTAEAPFQSASRGRR